MIPDLHKDIIELITHWHDNECKSWHRTEDAIASLAGYIVHNLNLKYKIDAKTT